MSEYPVYDALQNALSHLRGRKVAAQQELKKLDDIAQHREELHALIVSLDAEIAHIEPRLAAHAPASSGSGALAGATAHEGESP